MDLRQYGDLKYGELKNNSNGLPVYGPFERLLLSDWGQSKINHNIAKAFSTMNINQMVPIQKHSFLYLMNHYNTAIIGFSKGKSTAYLASIFSLIMNNRHDDQLNNVAIGPKAIIFSSSLGSCSDLHYLSKRFNNALPEAMKIKVVVAYSFIPVLQIIGSLLNGCDILITTPTSLINIVNKTKLFHWINLKHVVFDNIDLMLENYENQMPFLLNKLLKLKESSSNIQFISTSVTWSKEIDIFLNKLFFKWQYIFGSHLEATRFMNIGLSLVQVQNNKLQKLLEFLNNNVKYRRCVLITSCTDELNEMYDYINKNSSNIKVVVPGALKSSKVFTQLKWNQPLDENQLVFICSDEMLYDFYIDNADCLIHYDIPADKSSFSIRFSVLQDSKTILRKKERISYIFLSNNNKDMIQLPKVVDIMKSFGNGIVEPILLKHVKIINEALEKQKKNSIFCSNIVKFGICTKRSVCKNRHILLKNLDEPAVNIPKTGLAIVQIINVYDASHMSGKLLSVNSTKNLNDDQSWAKVEDQSNIINSKLLSFYENKNNRILHEDPTPGDMVAVQLEKNIRGQMNTIFLRAIVLDLIDTHTMNPKVTIKLIDEGRIDIVPTLRLFILPDLMKSLKTDTVDIILASVKPIDNDKTWCAHANISVKKQFKHAQECGETIIVKVNMALGTTIWTKTIYRKYWHFKSKSYSTEEILPALLLDTGFADLNPEHIRSITELSILAGINKPLLQNNDQDNIENYKFSLKEYMSLYKLPKPQWAHLDEYCNMVSVQYICNPKLFFVCNAKYIDKFNDIQTKIKNYIEQKQVLKLQLTHIVEEAIGLAKYPQTDQYYRVQIISILSTQVEVMFVDLGEIYAIESNSLLTIHPDLVVQLPFQAIECSLRGFKDTKVTSDELDELNDYFFDLTENQINLKVVSTDGLAELTDGSHYEVVLYSQELIVNLEMQRKFSQHCDDTQMSELLNIVNNMSTDNIEPYCLDVDTILDEEMTSESCSLHMKFLDEMGFLKQFNCKWNENNLLQVEKVHEYNLEEEKVKEDVEIKNENAIRCTTVDTIKETESVDSGFLEKTKSKIHKQESCTTNKKICLTCNTNIQSIVPACVWYQDEQNIYLKFNILKIDNFQITYEEDCLTFKGQFDDISYNFTAILYGFICEKNITHKRSYEGFHIKAEKCLKIRYKWPRLFKCNKWHKYLMYDPEHLEIKQNSLLLKNLNKYKMLALGSSITFDPKSDSDTDEADESSNIIFEDEL